MSFHFELSPQKKTSIFQTTKDFLQKLSENKNLGFI